MAFSFVSRLHSGEKGPKTPNPEMSTMRWEEAGPGEPLKKAMGWT